MLKNYLKIACRNIIKHKVFSLINIIGLTIGLSASFIIGLMIYYDYTFDNFHRDSDRIYRVVTNFNSPNGKFYNSGITLALEEAIKENSNLEIINGFTIERPSIVENKEENIVKKWPSKVIFSTGEYFEIFDYNFLAGNKNNILKNPNEVILTHKRAQQYFPKLTPNDMIGKTLIYNDSINVKVIGIVENLKGRTDFYFQEFISRPTILSTRLRDDFLNKNWNATSSNSQLIIKVISNQNINKIQKEFDNLADTHLDEDSRKHKQTRKFVLQPLSDIHFNSNYGIYNWEISQPSKPLLRNLGLVAIFLLLLGCINFINLNTAQATQRAKEIGIRKALGSSRKQLITQFMGETLLLVLISGLLSIVLSKWLINIFSDFVQEGLTFSLLGNPKIIFGVVLLLIIVTFLSGFYPALVISKFNVISVLKNNLGSGEKKALLRKFLTIFQFTIAQIFIIATLLVGKQINFLLNKDMGFKTDAVASIYSPRSESELEKKQLFLQKLKAIPQINHLSLGGFPPASNSLNTSTSTYTDGEKKIQSDIQFIFGDTNYAELFELKLLAGKVYKNDTLRELVINETARKTFGFKTPDEAIGKFLDFSGTKTPIVGVMEDFHQQSLRSDINPLALTGDWYRPQHSRYMAIHASFYPNSSREFKKTIDKIKEVYNEVYTEIEDFRIEFMDETVTKFYDKENKISRLLSWSTGLSILISCLGLWGLVIYTTNRRVKEIGIRKVLGASIIQINTLLCKEFLLLVSIAFVLASPIAWYGIHSWLQNFSYRTDIGFITFLISGLIMIVFALLVICIKTIQAAKSNPVKSLRSE
ncbi:cell division protein FtsX [Tenacibaculum sp. SZ-18]|uniref:ABC transporter permease n=1 Tax=Tenacibaculum sp. SZ-18 TaxID=754423 RepID=UPI000C2D5098|nr:ABC transporter permease [Tenacibaculum sp. SZ-18]AUC15951.1 cell division protein FtsX [Tenacibaculum sp. SZ-18]